MHYDTLIFDLDGTLLDTLDDLTDSLNFALSQYDLPTYQKEEVKYFVGSGIKVMIERALKKNSQYFDKVYETFIKHYEKNNTNKTTVYPEVLETIKKLAEAKIKMAIVSNKYQQAVNDICMPLFGDYIKVMIGEQPGLNKKPSGDMVHLAISKLQADPFSTAYVGDSDIDYLTAQNAGLDFIGAAWGFRGRKILENLKSTYVIDQFKELLKII